MHHSIIFYLLISLSFGTACSQEEELPSEEYSITCDNVEYDYTGQTGCDGQIYPHPDSSQYILPIKAGTFCPMGLTNCSSSFHGPGRPDQYAFDFDVAEGTVFAAARGGTVIKVVNNQNSDGGGAGNMVFIDHGDGTFGGYLHSPAGGILVERGQEVRAGDALGIVGRSGLAGYPHLHFIVTRGTRFPWEGIAVSFRNALPPDIVLQTGAAYVVCEP